MGIAKQAKNVAGVCALVAAASACVTAGGLTAPPGSSLPASPSTSPTATDRTSPQNCGGADHSIDRGPYLIAGFPIPGYGFPDMGFSSWDMALHSTVVAAGVVAQEPGVFSTRFGLTVYTPYEVEVEQALRGRMITGRAAVTVEGGTAGCYTAHVDVAPLLQVGQRYVLYLGDPALGSDIGEVWEAWRIDAGDMVQTPGGPMSLADLAARIERLKASATP